MRPLGMAENEVRSWIGFLWCSFQKRGKRKKNHLGKMGKKRKDASKRDEAVIKKEEGKSATSSGANAAEAARAPAGGKDNTKASGAGDDEGKAGQQEDVSGSSGGAACMFLFLVLGLVTAATVMAAYAAEDMQFADMPSEVQSWLETGHYIPVSL